MPAFDRDPVALALADLQAGGRAAIEALQQVQPMWSHEVIATKIGYKRSTVSRVVGTGVKPPSEAECTAIDRLCAQVGAWPENAAPFSLAGLRQRWEDLRQDAAAVSVERSGPFRIQVGTPPPAAAALQPRAALLQRVSDSAGGSGVVVHSVAVGDGGVGKTQLARAVWDHAEDANGARVRVWVDAKSRSSIVSAYAAAAVKIGVVEAGHDDDDGAAIAFLAWCGETRVGWLIVLDDIAVDPVDVLDLWPPHTNTGQVVATTRRTDIRPAGTGSVTVDVFTSEEAIAYLHERLSPQEISRARGGVNARDGAAELAEELECLPLALAQAASYVLRRARTCRSYLTEFRDQKRTIHELFPRLDAADSYAHTVATAWSLAIAAADELDPVGLARPALALAAILNPAGIPETVWTSDAGRNYLASHRKQMTAGDTTGALTGGDVDVVTTTDALDALRNLQLFSVLTHTPAATPDEDSAAGMVRVHSLVQRSTRDQLTPDEYDDTVWAAADALLDLWPAHRHDPVLATNTAALQRGRTDVLWSADSIHPLLFHLPRSLVETGQISLAAQAYIELETKASTLLGPDHPQTLFIRMNLATMRGQAGDVAGAAAAFEQLLPDQLRVLGPDHPSTLTTRGNLAGLRGEAGDIVGAVAAFEELLTDRLRVLGPDHPDVLTTRSNLATMRGKAGDAAGAVDALQELLTDRSRVLGADYPDTLATRGNLALWRGEAGDAAGAAATFEELLTDQLRVLGPDHPGTLTTRNDLAAMRGHAGDAAGAVAALQELLTDQLRVLGPDHPGTLTTRSNLATMGGQAGNTACAALQELLTDRLRVLGPDHPDTLITRSNLAVMGGGPPGNAASAAAALQELLTDQLRVLGPDHPDTLTTRNNLATVGGQAGDAAGAADALEELLADRLRVLGPDHPNTLITRNNLAAMRGQAGDAAAAAAAFEELLADRLRVLGADHPDTMITRNNLATWRGKAGDAAGAAAALQELLTDQLRVLGPDHPNTLATRSNLQQILQDPNG